MSEWPNEEKHEALFEVMARYSQGAFPDRHVVRGGLNVDVVAGTGSGFAEELRSMKAALLYADHVHLHSLPVFYGLTGRACVAESFEGRIQFVLEVFEAQGNKLEGQEKDRFVAKMTTEGSELLRRMPEAFAPPGGADKLDEIEAAVNSGLVSVQPYRGKGRYQLAMDFLANIQELLEDRDTLPMFDETASAILREGVELGSITLPDSPKPHRRHAALAVDLMQRLPVVDAEIERILEVREEIAPHLKRFRGAISSYSSSISSEPWDVDFPYDADQVFTEKVGPAIEEIEEAMRNVRTTSKLVGSLGNAWPAAGSSALAMAISSLNSVAAAAVGAIGAAAGLGVFGAKAYDTIRAEQQKYENNQLYLYYEASKM